MASGSIPQGGDGFSEPVNGHAKVFRALLECTPLCRINQHDMLPIRIFVMIDLFYASYWFNRRYATNCARLAHDAPPEGGA